MSAHLFSSMIFYTSPKLVRHRSFKVACCYQLLQVAVLVYIVVFAILQDSRHLSKALPAGLVRLQLQEPVKDHCNPMDAGCESGFTPTGELHYCEGGVKLWDFDYQLPCQYMDARSMVPSGRARGDLLIPTRITEMHQKATEGCNRNWTRQCQSLFTFSEENVSSTYVADVERFTLLVDHAFTLPRKKWDRRGNSLGFLGSVMEHFSIDDLPPVGQAIKFQGAWEQCEDPANKEGCRLLRIPCANPEAFNCNTEEASMSEHERAHSLGLGIIGISAGDIIPIKTLLNLTRINLDLTMQEAGRTYRHEGIGIELKVEYSNFQAWHFFGGPIKYVYSVSLLPIDQYKEVSEVLSSGHRTLYDQHGIYIQTLLVGELGYFDPLMLMMTLTAIAGCMALTNKLLDFLLVHCDREFNKHKFVETDADDYGLTSPKMGYVCCNDSTHTCTDAETEAEGYFRPRELCRDDELLDNMERAESSKLSAQPGPEAVPIPRKRQDL